MEASGRATSSGEFSFGDCPLGCLFHPGSFQRLAGLVFVSSHGLHYDYAS